MNQPRERNHRLPPGEYQGARTVAFTVCERTRTPHLLQPAVHEIVCKALEAACARWDCRVIVFTLMPDHLHVLFQGMTDSSSVLEAMNSFKWKSGFNFATKKLPCRWQKDFYDHVIRDREEWAKHARYIALNPVRQRLVEDPLLWPHSGSIGYQFEEIWEDAFWS